MSRLLFIVNPKSGIRKRIDIPATIKSVISPEHQYEIVFTEHKGHATEYALQGVKDKYDGLVAIGGDGTINECAQALLHTNVPLGIIPMGSGNGLARHLKIPMKIRNGLAVIKNMNHRTIDTGQFNSNLFLSNAGLGFVAAVADDFDSGNVSRGFTGYSYYTLKTFFSYKSLQYSIKVDDAECNQECFMVNICNSNQFGYEARICPEADIDDGLLDIVLVHKTNLFNNVRFIYELFQTNVLKNKYVQHIKGRKIEIQSILPAHAQVDGEPLGKIKSVSAAIDPLSLKVIVPAKP